MKKYMLLMLVSGLALTYSYAQCDKPRVWTASKAEFLDESGNLRDTKITTVTIHTSGQKLVILHSDDPADSLQGPVSKLECAWKNMKDDGKMVFTAKMSDPSGDPRDASLQIEVKDGKLMAILSVHGPDDRIQQIRIPIDSVREE